MAEGLKDVARKGVASYLCPREEMVNVLRGGDYAGGQAGLA